MTFGVQSAVFCFIYIVSNTKFFVHRKCLSTSEYDYDFEQKGDLISKSGFESLKNEEYVNDTYVVSYKSLPESEL